MFNVSCPLMDGIYDVGCVHHWSLSFVGTVGLLSGSVGHFVGLRCCSVQVFV